MEGRTRENIIIVILCVFLAYVWFNYNSPEILKLSAEREELLKELESLRVRDRQQEQQRCVDTCETELTNFQNRNPEFREHSYLTTRIENLERKLPKADCIKSDKHCALDTFKQGYEKIRNELKDRIASLRVVLENWQNRIRSLLGRAKTTETTKDPVNSQIRDLY